MVDLRRWPVEVPGWYPAGVSLVATSEGLVCEVRDRASGKLIAVRPLPWAELDQVREEASRG